MKNDPFAPSAAITAVDKMLAFEKPLRGLEWLAELDAKLLRLVGKQPWERRLHDLK